MPNKIEVFQGTALDVQRAIEKWQSENGYHIVYSSVSNSLACDNKINATVIEKVVITIIYEDNNG